MSALLAAAMLAPWLAAAILAPLDGRRRAAGWAAAAVLAASLAALAVLYAHVLSTAPVRLVAGGWPEGIGIVLRADALGLVFALLSTLVLLAALLHEVLSGVGDRRFPALVLFLAAGLNGLFLTGDVFNFYVFFELSMTSAYVLTTYRRREREAGAALIFAVVNLLGSFVFLIGVASLYHLVGTLEMSAVAERLGGDVDPGAAILIAVAFFVAFGVKLGLFPFHFWLPSVYTAAQPAIAAILAGALANIGSYGLLRFGGEVLSSQLAAASTALIAVGVASLLYGGLQAVGRPRPADVLAYSSIGQVGYILVAIGVGGPLGFAAAVVYSVVNALSKALLFMSTRLRGWLVATATAVGVLSVAGMPPAAGYVGKLAVLRAGVDADSALLVAVLLAGTALSFLYMFQLYQHRFWETGGEGQEGGASPAPVRGVVAALGLLLLCLGLWPEPLVAGGQQAAAVLAGGP